jgi:ABC-type nitrate/sulfonate/bicarbonate transport system substrate-binding protein
MAPSGIPLRRTSATLAIAFAAALLCAGCEAKPGTPAPAAGDLTKHPVYSKYDFGKTPDVIDLATQPLATPEGPLGEVMARDLVLQERLRKLGVRIRVHPFLKGGDINFFMDRGQVDVAIVGDMPTLMMASKSSIRVAALAKMGYGSVVLREGTLVEDLRRKRIGYAPGTTGHFVLLGALSQAKLAETDVSLLPMDVDSMPGALSRGEIDGFSSWEPAPTVAIASDPRVRTVFRMANSSYLYFSNRFFGENPEAAKEIVAAVIRAVHWMRADHRNLLNASEWTVAAGEALAGRKYGCTAEQIVILAGKNLVDVAGAPILPQSHLRQDGPLHKEFLFLQSQGKIPASVAWETVVSCFDPELAKAVLSSPVRYRVDEFRYSGDAR